MADEVGFPASGATRGDTHVQTFLIADVRGYTLFTQERGDESAGKLAAKFAGIARDVVEARGGTLLELRGDEALSVFLSPRQAIRAAVELQERFVEETLADPELPLTVGIGLDAGEAVAVEGGYRGGALNLAARLCGEAAKQRAPSRARSPKLSGTMQRASFALPTTARTSCASSTRFRSRAPRGALFRQARKPRNPPDGGGCLEKPAET
jgi:hypothetical protein